MTTLITCSHGTRFDAGRREIRALVELLRQRLPDVVVEQAFVDVEQPNLDEVLGAVAGDGPIVVVPLLLSTGFHVKVDIAAAVGRHPNAVQAAPLGPHEVLVAVLRDRLVQAGAFGGGGEASGPADHIVLAAAGSTDPAAAFDVERIRDGLQQVVPVPVSLGYAAGAQPRIPDAIEDARRAGSRRVVAASYVLAPGFFADVVAAAGADAVTAPLGADARIAALAAQRYRAALAGARR